MSWRRTFSGCLGASVAVSVAYACGSGSSDFANGGSSQPTGGGASFSAGGASGSNGAGGAGSGDCTESLEPCEHPDDCCSEFCIDGLCIVPGDCEVPGEECTQPSQCCTGRCEPETGTGKVKCLDFCFDDGQSCEKALDCCSLACHGGVCGGAQCFIESTPCSADSDCCSNICARGECQIDPTNTDCRPVGETCNSGSGNGCCNECDESQDPPICVYGDDVCKPTGSLCETDADCCKGQCLPDSEGVLRCDPGCVATGLPCEFSAECCETNCVGGECLPADDPCVPTGGPCTDNVDCCGGLCVAGHCDLPCELTGSSCASGAECCSGLCSAGECAKLN